MVPLMASPQTSDGFTRIANELMGALIRTRIPGEQMQVYLCILRQTYGYNQTEACIPLTLFSAATGMDKGSVKRALRGLLERNMIRKKEGGKKAHPSAKCYMILKDYEKWKRGAKKPRGGKKAPKRGANLTPTPIKENSKESIVEFEKIVSRLNEKAGTKFSPKSKSTQGHISARIKDGFSLDDFFAVIDYKCREWLPDPNMAQYLRPDTLFAGKFEGYLQAAKRAAPQGGQRAFG